MNFLVLTNNTNSDTISRINKAKHFPFVCNSINSAANIIKHHSISGVVIDNEHQNIDTLEFILNVKELDSYINKILLPKEDSVDVLEKLKILKMETILYTKRTFSKILREKFN